MAGRHGWVALTLVVLSGCGDDAPANTTESSSEGSTSIDPSTSSTNASADSSSEGGGSTSTDASSSSGGGESTSTGAESTSSGGESTSTGVESTESSTTAVLTESSGVANESSSTGDQCIGQPDGSSCNQPCECNSDSCFVVGILGGLCGECDEDADCPNGGCSPPEPVLQPPLGAVCNDGSLGGGCQTDAACQEPLVCAVVLDVPGVITTSTCGECELDDDCGTDLCSPEYAFPSLGGSWQCVAPGSEPIGSGCAFDGSGDQSCASGMCAEADVMGLFSVGVCSECEVDDDCTMANQICQPAGVDLDAGLIPATCV
jgi:hypothetical protein